MFAILWGVIWRDLPVPGGDRIVAVRGEKEGPGEETRPLYPYDLAALSGEEGLFEELIAFQALFSFVTAGSAGTEGAVSAYVTPNFFRALEVETIQGRSFGPNDGAPGSPLVAVIGYQLWSDLFARDHDVIGRELLINRQSVTVVGVAPQGFGFPLRQQLWIAFDYGALAGEPGMGAPLFVVGKRPPGVSPEVLDARLADLASRLARDSPLTHQGWRLGAEEYVRAHTDPELRSALLAAFAAVAGVLLIACANLTNLLLVLVAQRRPEVAVRSAVGASPGSVVALVVTQSLVLAVPGAAAGVALAALAGRLFDALASASDGLRAFWIDVRVDPAVLLFCAVSTLVAVVASAAMPALQAGRRTDLGSLLRGETTGRGGGRPTAFSRAIVIGQVAFSCGLLVATGLLARSVWNLATVERGYSSDELVVAQLALFQRDYEDDAERVATLRRIERRLDELPGVASAGLSSAIPSGGARTVSYSNAGGFDGAELVVTPSFFETFGLRAVEGRLLAWTDGEGRSPVVVVSRRMAESLGGPGAAVGRELERASGEPSAIVVGVVDDVALSGAYGELRPLVAYYPLAQKPQTRMYLVARSNEQSPTVLLPALRNAAAEVDPQVAVYEAQLLQDVERRETWLPRALASLFVLFAGAALLLSIIGVFGLTSVATRLRAWEVGLRMALGAQRGSIRRLFVRHGLAQLVPGLLLGALLGWWTTRLVAGQLYGVEAWNPGVLAAVLVVQGATGVLAIAVPAWRISRIEPATTLGGA
jgi:predicted permease